MLQRAASNAYSWWLASHIRTKQSKWLEQNLQDMEEQVQGVLKLIQEDGDSFAKRAEMYYKKRPEITSFVEESYKAYRALAERYDHISTELQNANNTIASVFPEQVEFAMDEDYEDGSPRARKKPTDAPKGNIPNVPNVPTKDLKGLLKSSAKKLRPNKPTKIGNPSVAAAVKSGLSKTEALKEIDSLQKGILALQTEKEFAKVSYERSLEKYWEIEERITGMHEKICKLQDEFGISAVIEDEEARTLMTSAALKSCQDTLAQLQEKQETSVMEARVEHQKIRDVREKLKALKDEFHCNGINEEDKDSDAKSNAVEVGETPNGLLEQEETAAAQGRELEKLREKIKEQLSAGGSASLTVTEMAQKVDEIVTKVVSLETAVSSQTALIRRLRAENDELQSQIGNLENDRVTACTAGGEKNNVGSKIRKMEEKLNGVQDLNQSIENQNNNLQTHFTEAHCNLDHLTKKLHSMKPDEEIPDIDSFREGEESITGIESQSVENQNNNLQTHFTEEHCNLDHLTKKLHSMKPDEEIPDIDSFREGEESITGIESQTESIEKKEFEVQEARLNPSSDFKGNKDQKTEVRDETVGSPPNVKPQESRTDQDEEPNWRQLFLNGLEDREKVLLGEYTSVLRNYKEAKKKVGEVERKNQDSLRELESANAIKDEEIQSLRQKLTLLQGRLNDDINSKEAIDSDHKPSSNSPRNEESMDGKLTPTEEEGDNVTVILIDPPNNISAIEEKFRMKIDELLEQNLDFWLRFSTSFHQIQTYQTGIEDLQVELSKLTSKLEEKPEGGSHSGRHSLKSDARPIYKHLREIQTELSVWVEHSVLLKDELQCRFSSLCEIQEQISKESNEGSEEGHKLTGFQAAKFQGEVMNMKQENNKVADELQAGLDHVTGLQFEVEKTVAKLNEEFELVGSKNHSNSQFKHSTSRGRVPLRSFIFGAKAKPQKPSIFSCVQPVLHRKYNDLRAGLPTSLKSGSSRSKDA